MLNPTAIRFPDPSPKTSTCSMTLLSAVCKDERRRGREDEKDGGGGGRGRGLEERRGYIPTSLSNKRLIAPPQALASESGRSREFA